MPEGIWNRVNPRTGLIFPVASAFVHIRYSAWEAVFSDVREESKINLNNENEAVGNIGCSKKKSIIKRRLYHGKLPVH